MWTYTQLTEINNAFYFKNFKLFKLHTSWHHKLLLGIDNLYSTYLGLYLTLRNSYATTFLLKISYIQKSKFANEKISNKYKLKMNWSKYAFWSSVIKYKLKMKQICILKQCEQIKFKDEANMHSEAVWANIN